MVAFTTGVMCWCVWTEDQTSELMRFDRHGNGSFSLSYRRDDPLIVIVTIPWSWSYVIWAIVYGVWRREQTCVSRKHVCWSICMAHLYSRSAYELHELCQLDLMILPYLRLPIGLFLWAFSASFCYSLCFLRIFGWQFKGGRVDMSIYGWQFKRGMWGYEDI